MKLGLRSLILDTITVSFGKLFLNSNHYKLPLKVLHVNIIAVVGRASATEVTRGSQS